VSRRSRQHDPARAVSEQMARASSTPGRWPIIVRYGERGTLLRAFGRKA
jgi:hypothetical protein